jgi:hypothetical protein
MLQWIIFLNVNPYPINNDNKLSIMNYIPIKYRPEVQFHLKDIKKNKFTYPIVIKPIICSNGGRDVSIIRSKEELDKFLSNLNHEHYMIQNYLYDYDKDVAVLYEKWPFEKEGKVIQVVAKTQNDEIREFKSSCMEDHSYLINEKINRLFAKITQNVPNMNVCRYDLRLKSLKNLKNDLEQGNFKAVEVNGTMGFELFKNYFFLNKVILIGRWYFKRLIIGVLNILLLKGYSFINLISAMIKSFKNVIFCKDWEDFFALYS